MAGSIGQFVDSQCLSIFFFLCTRYSTFSTNDDDDDDDTELWEREKVSESKEFIWHPSVFGSAIPVRLALRIP